MFEHLKEQEIKKKEEQEDKEAWGVCDEVKCRGDKKREKKKAGETVNKQNESNECT